VLKEREKMLTVGQQEFTQAELLVRALNQFSSLLNRAFDGNVEAQRRVCEIDKLCSTFKPFHFSISISRAYDFISTYRIISYQVLPSPKNKCCVFHGPIILNSEQIIPFKSRLEVLWNPKSTLKSLAIKFYLEDMHNKGFDGLDVRVIQRDLQFLEKYRRLNCPKSKDTFLTDPWQSGPEIEREVWRQRYKKKK
jgi:hypothetical protein